MNPRIARSAAGDFARVTKDRFRSLNGDSPRDVIPGGAIRQGSRIIEVVLTEQFGVGCGPKREAIRQPIEEGTLEAAPDTATDVIDISVTAFDEIDPVRRTLEIVAFELVWDRRRCFATTCARSRPAGRDRATAPRRAASVASVSPRPSRESSRTPWLGTASASIPVTRSLATSA